MAKNGSSKGMVPEARNALDRFKMEAAADDGVPMPFKRLKSFIAEHFIIF